MIIHFFKKRDEELIDFASLIDDYFDKLDNVKISSNEQEVKIEKYLKEFDFSYSFLITKRARISCLYRLNSAFVNVNMFIDIPCLLPQYISRLILEHVGEICKKYNLYVFVEGDDDIKQFNMFNLINHLAKKKNEAISLNPSGLKYRLPMNTLNDVCEYQRLTSSLADHFKDYVFIPDYTVMYDKSLDQVKLGVVWKKGEPSVFPPYLDYILVESNDALECVIPSDVFFKHLNRFVDDRDYSIGFKIKYISQRSAQKAIKFLLKLKKSEVSINNFDFLKVTELTEN